MATASGILGIVSSATEQTHALTMGFGIGAGFCSLVAGSIGLHERLARLPREKQDPEWGRSPIELKSPSTIGLVHDAEVSVATGIEQRRTLRALHANRQPYAPYDSSMRYNASSKGYAKRRQSGIQVSTAPLERLKEKFNDTRPVPRSAALLDLAIDVVQAAEAVNTNKTAFRPLAREVCALAHDVVEMCIKQTQALGQSGDEDSTQSHMNAVFRLIEQARELTVTSAAGKEPRSPWHLQEERDKIKAFVENSASTRRQSKAYFQRQLVGTTLIPRLPTVNAQTSAVFSLNRDREQGFTVESSTTVASRDDKLREQGVPSPLSSSPKIAIQPSVSSGLERGSSTTRIGRSLPPHTVPGAIGLDLKSRGAEASNRESTMSLGPYHASSPENRGANTNRISEQRGLALEHAFTDRSLEDETKYTEQNYSMNDSSDVQWVMDTLHSWSAPFIQDLMSDVMGAGLSGGDAGDVEMEWSLVEE
ncbi:hypothetical protein PQX77_006533 [Marasmius sp. AFHP31]|nr:hypothetical protein PQX77_006533 [Marasmius sp. AFHP31]